MLELFLTFAKIGLFTFGGGYAMISLIEDICVEQKKWLTHEQMMEVTVVAESTPGPIAINCATYTGYLRGGMRGAVAATVGMVLPSFVIIYAISQFLDRFLEIRFIASAFQGIKLAVGLLILNAGRNMWKKMKKTPLSRGIVLTALAVLLAGALLSVSVSSLALMLLAGGFSLTLYLAKQKGGRQ
ncbi:MAG: chromate transporter [Oscillospiraceae bacterium]|nr:chromate transporter [Oscillospiraceae bacterium]